MKPVKTEASNFTYTGPTPEIGDLPCELVAGERGGKDTYSVWSLTDEEREAIAMGAHIRLGIVGMHPIPPVSLEVVMDEQEQDEKLAYLKGQVAGLAGESSADNPYLNCMGEIPEGTDSLVTLWGLGYKWGDHEASRVIAPVEDFGEEEYAG